MAKGLGKGLDSLFEENTTDFDNITEAQTHVNISKIEPNRSQPRKAFEKDALEELASSVAENGVLQPIIVRPYKNGQYQIVSGERRWRAARLAGLTEVPVVIKELDDKSTLEIALIENLQREDLNAVEEARGYKTLIEEFSLTQEQTAKRVGKSRPAVANAMRILVLPDKVLDMVLSGQLTSGHARALIPLYEKTENIEQFFKVVDDIIKKNLTVRDVENMARLTRPGQKKKKTDKNAVYYNEICDSLSKTWGRKIKIKSDNKQGNKGTITFEYYGKDDFETLIQKLSEVTE